MFRSPLLRAKHRRALASFAGKKKAGGTLIEYQLRQAAMYEASAKIGAAHLRDEIAKLAEDLALYQSYAYRAREAARLLRSHPVLEGGGGRPDGGRGGLFGLVGDVRSREERTRSSSCTWLEPLFACYETLVHSFVHMFTFTCSLGDQHDPSF